MFLQQYDYEYIDKHMAHVNALSRCNSILVLVGNIFEQVLSIKQEDQEEICKIRNRLEKGEDKLYELRNGFVPYIAKINKNKLLFYVPEIMKNNVICTYHDDIRHVEASKVITHITKIYWFPDMQAKVKSYIKNCLKCIEYSPSNGRSERYLHSFPKGKLSFQTYHIDHYGPLEKTRL